MIKCYFVFNQYIFIFPAMEIERCFSFAFLFGQRVQYLKRVQDVQYCNLLDRSYCQYFVRYR